MANRQSEKAGGVESWSDRLERKSAVSRRQANRQSNGKLAAKLPG